MKKLIEIKEKYPTTTKIAGLVVLVMIALVVISLGFNLFFSFKISIYKQTIYDLKAQMYARQAEAKHARMERDLLKKEMELNALKRKGEEYEKQREAKRKEIEKAKKKVSMAKKNMEEENNKLDGKKQEDVVKVANTLLKKNKGKTK